MAVTAKTTEGAVVPPSIWRNRKFVLVWAANNVSLIGTQASMIAVPLTAILTLHAGAFAVGALAATQQIPVLVISPVGGVWVDRWPRRTIQMATDAGCALIMATIPVAWGLGVLALGQLYAVALAVGFMSVVGDTSARSMLPTLVHESQLVDASSKMGFSESLAETAGPSLGGVLVQALSAPIAIIVDAVSYVCSAFLIWRLPRDVDTPRPSGGRNSLFSDLKQGFVFVRDSRTLRWCAALAADGNFFLSIIMAVEVLYAVRVLGFNPVEVGLLLSALGTGGLAGALGAARLVRWAGGTGRVASTSAVITGCAAVAFGLVTGPGPLRLAWALLAYGILGSTASIFRISTFTLRMTVTPRDLLGRVNGTMRFFIQGVAPVGLIAGGALGAWVGLRAAVLGAGAALTLTTLIFVLSPLVGEAQEEK
jgi:predicted MFS family arabinose efflux permease